MTVLACQHFRLHFRNIIHKYMKFHTDFISLSQEKGKYKILFHCLATTFSYLLDCLGMQETYRVVLYQLIPTNCYFPIYHPPKGGSGCVCWFLLLVL